MKTTRRVFAFVLALTMVFALALTAAATGEIENPTARALTNTGTLTIQGATAGTTYTLYRVLDLVKVTATTSGELQDPLGNPINENVYVVSEKWIPFFTATDDELAKGNQYLNVTYSNSDKLYYVTGVTFNTATAQSFAKDVLAYATQKGINNDGSSDIVKSGTHESINPRQYGYYVMVNDRSGDDVQYNAFSLDQPKLTIKEKNTKFLVLTKEVQEDSKVTDANGGWGSSNAAEIEQTVNFRIIVTFNADTDKLVITDTMPNFEGVNITGILFSGGEIAEVDASGVGQYTKEVTENGFTITLMDNFRQYIEEGNTMRIEYTARLKSDAVIADGGNRNTAQLKSNDRVVDEATTTTYTYQVNVNKVNENDMPLKDVVFNLKNPTGNVLRFEKNGNKYTVTADPAASADLTTDANGQFIICGLDTMDAYTLTETKEPAGYVKMDDATILIDVENSEDAQAIKEGTYSIKVENLPGVELPETGGMGTTVFYVAGGLMVAAAVILLVLKKRAV